MPPCESLCGKKLSCGRHQCDSTCHSGMYTTSVTPISGQKTVAGTIHSVDRPLSNVSTSADSEVLLWAEPTRRGMQRT